MDSISREDLAVLTTPGGETRVSLYSPMVRLGPETAQNPIRWKNLLTGVEAALRRERLPASEVDALLDPARGLVRDGVFWEYQSDGLAFFARPGWARWFRLPVAVPALATVGDRFFMAPLHERFAAHGRFLLLALSRQRARLFDGDRLGLKEAPEALPARPVINREARDRPGAFAAGHGKAGTGVVFHARGGVEQRRREQTLRYFRAVDAAVGRHANSDRPLLLAGIGGLVALYRQVSTYPGIVPRALVANADQLPLDVLHAQAWTLLEPLLRHDEHAAIARYRQALGTGYTVDGPAAVVAAAVAGRVDTLFLAASAFAGATSGGPLVLRLGTDAATTADQLDRAVTACLAHGGAVHTVPDGSLPHAGPVAALLRF